MGRNYCTDPLVVMTTVKSKKHSPTKKRFILPKILFIRVFLNLLEFQKNVHFSNFNNDKQIHIWPSLTSHNNGSPNRFIKILFNVLTFLIPCECAIFERVLRKTFLIVNYINIFSGLTRNENARVS